MLQEDRDEAIRLLALREIKEGVDESQLIDWAFKALERGFEPKSVLYLAGTTANGDIREKFDLFKSALIELGFQPPQGNALLTDYVRLICRQFLAGELSQDESMGRLYPICQYTGWESDLKFNQPYLNLLHEWDFMYYEADDSLAEKLRTEFHTKMTKEFRRFLEE